MALSSVQKAMRLELAKYQVAASIYNGLKDSTGFNLMKVIQFTPDGGFYTGILKPLHHLMDNDVDIAIQDQSVHLVMENLRSFENYDLSAEIVKVQEADKALREFTGGKAEAIAMAMELSAMIQGLYPPMLYKTVYEHLLSRPTDPTALTFENTIPALDLLLLTSDDIKLMTKILTDGPFARKEVVKELLGYECLKNYMATIDLVVSHC